ncbi:hypothetical protein Hanom_Chr11g00975091 [Helianthus anomalus]
MDDKKLYEMNIYSYKEISAFHFHAHSSLKISLSDRILKPPYGTPIFNMTHF